jgi:poly-gamma-glutamate capsule biosynthesis protein CapA/YwtB (metallophosphatase superfamily)
MAKIRRLLWLPVLTLLLPIACAPAPATATWPELYRRADWQGDYAVDLRAVGDVMAGRFVAERAAHEGYAAPFAALADLLAGDLVLGNLESPLTDRREQLRPGPYRLPAPAAFAPELRVAGFDLLSLANNHALDAGPAGLADAREHLQRVGIATAGVGNTAAEAYQPQLLEAGGLTLAVLAFNDVADPADGSGRPNPDFAACTAAAGCQMGRAWLDAQAPAAVAQARNRADLVVVMVHWGREYAPEISPRQRDQAGRLVAAGADLVLGSHPHVLQQAEMLHAGGRAGYVAYSLGNFLFDAPDDPAISSGAVLQVLLDAAGVAQVNALPLHTAGGQPTPLNVESPAAQAALARLRGTSAAPPTAAVVPTSTVASAAVIVWRWTGERATALPAADTAFPARPTCLPADLRGNGEPQRVCLDAAGVLTVAASDDPAAAIVWRNEDPAWQIRSFAVGDPNDDGRSEVLFLLWKPDETGVLRSHPFMLGRRSGEYRIIWGGSATAVPIQDLALADLEGDGRGELLVLEGGSRPGDPAERLLVLRWHGWGFQVEWRSPPGSWQQLALRDEDGDGKPEILTAVAE